MIPEKTCESEHGNTARSGHWTPDSLVQGEKINHYTARSPTGDVYVALHNRTAFIASYGSGLLCMKILSLCRNLTILNIGLGHSKGWTYYHMIRSIWIIHHIIHLHRVHDNTLLKYHVNQHSECFVLICKPQFMVNHDVINLLMTHVCLPRSTDLQWCQSVVLWQVQHSCILTYMTRPSAPCKIMHAIVVCDHQQTGLKLHAGPRGHCRALSRFCLGALKSW